MKVPMALLFVTTGFVVSEASNWCDGYGKKLTDYHPSDWQDGFGKKFTDFHPSDWQDGFGKKLTDYHPPDWQDGYGKKLTDYHPCGWQEGYGKKLTDYYPPNLKFSDMMNDLELTDNDDVKLILKLASIGALSNDILLSSDEDMSSVVSKDILLNAHEDMSGVAGEARHRFYLVASCSIGLLGALVTVVMIALPRRSIQLQQTPLLG